MDTEFGNPLLFPPHHYRGIVLLRLPARVTSELILDTVSTLRDALLSRDHPPGGSIPLCADVIETPSLAEQLRDAPGELSELLRLVAARVAGPQEADALAGETERWIVKHLGADYAWPGNVRELEQCVRNVMIRGEYRPRRRAPAVQNIAGALEAGTLTAEALVRRYCTLVLARTGSYKQTARQLGMDRRTVKEKADRALLETLRSRTSTGRTGKPEVDVDHQA